MTTHSTRQAHGRDPPPFLRGMRHRRRQDRPGRSARLMRSCRESTAALRAGRARIRSCPRPPHFAPKAKRVIHLFMAGAPSQLDLFDYKPELARLEGKPLPPSVIGGQRYAFIRPDAAVLGPRFKFARHGAVRRRALGDAAAPGRGRRRHLPRQVGATPISSIMPPPRSSSTPGFSQPGRPSLGRG